MGNILVLIENQVRLVQVGPSLWLQLASGGDGLSRSLPTVKPCRYFRNFSSYPDTLRHFFTLASRVSVTGVCLLSACVFCCCGSVSYETLCFTEHSTLTMTVVTVLQALVSTTSTHPQHSRVYLQHLIMFVYNIHTCICNT